MTVSSHLLFSALLACATEPAVAPLETPEGQACAEAHAATVAAVSERFIQRGRPAPTRFPSQEDYVWHCLELDMTAEQMPCLDPSRAQADPEGCATILGEQKPDVDALSRWFNAELKKASADR